MCFGGFANLGNFIFSSDIEDVSRAFQCFSTSGSCFESGTGKPRDGKREEGKMEEWDVVQPVAKTRASEGRDSLLERRAE